MKCLSCAVDQNKLSCNPCCVTISCPAQFHFFSCTMLLTTTMTFLNLAGCRNSCQARLPGAVTAGHHTQCTQHSRFGVPTHLQDQNQVIRHLLVHEMWDLGAAA